MGQRDRGRRAARGGAGQGGAKRSKRAKRARYEEGVCEEGCEAGLGCLLLLYGP